MWSGAVLPAKQDGLVKSSPRLRIMRGGPTHADANRQQPHQGC